MRFEHESIAHSSLEFFYEIKFKAGLLTMPMVIYGCCLQMYSDLVLTGVCR